MGPSRWSNELFRFVVRSLIRSQIELKKEQDEQVNIYLAHLLLLLANPLYQEWASQYIREQDTSVFSEFGELQDRVQKYFAYKVNADHLLTSLGIFQSLGKPQGVARRFYEQEPKIYIGRGKAYYEMAAQFNRQIYRQSTSIEEVLQKLSCAFEEYVRVLSYIRSTYFDFVQRVSQEDFVQFLRQCDIS